MKSASKRILEKVNFSDVARRCSTLLCFPVLAACKQTYSWHQQLTVTVQTPAGEVSGHSVTEVTMFATDGYLVLPEARGIRSHIRGEAVVVEVAPSRYLFVLLDGVDQLAHPTFPQFPYERSGEFRNWARSIERHRGIGTVPHEDYPMMVTFTNISDPTSVQLVDPQDLAVSFGEGLNVTELTLRIIDAAVVEQVIPSFPFWSTLEEQGTFSGLTRFDPALPEPVKYLTNSSLVQD